VQIITFIIHLLVYVMVYSDYAQRRKKCKLTYQIRSTDNVVVPLCTTRFGVQKLYVLSTEPVYVFVWA